MFVLYTHSFHSFGVRTREMEALRATSYTSMVAGWSVLDFMLERRTITMYGTKL